MKRSFQLKATAFFVIAFMFSTASWAQMKEAAPKVLASPRDSVSAKVGAATITINYGSPSVKGRKIWDGLVPYGQVWRTGANEATTFTTSTDIWVEGKKLPAGEYGFFAIPGAKGWTIIFNSVPKQWGAFKYDATKDVLRVTVWPKKTTMHERLVYTIGTKGFNLVWEKLSVPVKVTSKSMMKSKA
jgi:hypothetical protein